MKTAIGFFVLFQEKLRECMEPAECLNMMEIEPTDDDDNETLNSLPVIGISLMAFCFEKISIA